MLPMEHGHLGDNAGCEHFGVHYYGAANKVTSRWLVRDAANPGSYVPVDPPMPVAWLNYTVQPSPSSTIRR